MVSSSESKYDRDFLDVWSAVEKQQDLIASASDLADFTQETDLYFLFDRASQDLTWVEKTDSNGKAYTFPWGAKKLHIFTEGALNKAAVATSLISGKNEASFYREAEEILESVEPLTKEKVLELYQTLWEGPLRESSLKITESFHPAIIIKNLKVMYDKIDELGERAFEKTGNDGHFGGANGSYFVGDFVFKPILEESYLKGSGIPFQGKAKREQMAYLLAKGQNARVPPTFFVEIEGRGVGSLQAYVHKAAPLSYYVYLGNGFQILTPALQSLAFLDGRLRNKDRTLSNVLAQETETGDVIPFGIDHGESFSEDPLSLPSIHYLSLPQVKAEIDKTVIQEILGIDIEKEVALMKDHGFQDVSIQWMRKSTTFFQMGVKKHLQAKSRGEKGFSPFYLLNLLQNKRDFILSAEPEELALLLGR